MTYCPGTGRLNQIDMTTTPTIISINFPEEDHTFFITQFCLKFSRITPDRRFTENSCLRKYICQIFSACFNAPA